MDESHVKTILQRWVEAINNQDVDLLGELLTKDYVWHRRGEKVLDIEATKKIMKNWFETSIPTMMVEDSFNSGDKTATRWTIRVKSRASGVETVVAGTSIDRIRDGKFAETWDVGSDKPWL